MAFTKKYDNYVIELFTECDNRGCNNNKWWYLY